MKHVLYMAEVAVPRRVFFWEGGYRSGPIILNFGKKFKKWKGKNIL